MKKIITLSLSILLFSTITKAQSDTTKIWKKGAVVGINLSQTSLTNWQGGGQNSLAANALFSGFTNYKKGRNVWDNSLDLGYGLLQQGNSKLIKSDDKIDFNSKYGRYAFKHWYYSALLNFKSQMAPGYNYPNDSVVISRFLAPAYILASIGMDYKPNDYFTMYISPITQKTTIVNDSKLNEVGAYGVDSGKVIRSEYGAYARFQYQKDVFTNVNFKTKLELFSNYLNNPQNIDVNWETLLSMKVNKYISATFSTTLIYDHDINIPVDKNNDGVVEKSGPRVQFREVLGVGLSYKF
jgi:Protein of unknown function (DUF3078)